MYFVEYMYRSIPVQGSSGSRQYNRRAMIKVSHPCHASTSSISVSKAVGSVMLLPFRPMVCPSRMEFPGMVRNVLFPIASILHFPASHIELTDRKTTNRYWLSFRFPSEQKLRFLRLSVPAFAEATMAVANCHGQFLGLDMSESDRGRRVP